MELLQLMNDDDDAQREKELNSVAEFVIKRITEKLKGCEIINAVKLNQEDNNANAKPRKAISVEWQVEELIKEATCHENLASCYIGWCPYW
jgi:phosphatidylinositol kinase/protein kinase (PI-3  family)